MSTMTAKLLRLTMFVALSTPALPLGARAQDIVCDGLDDFPCGYQIETHRLERAPARFRVQARVAQAGVSVGEGRFSQLEVRLRAGTRVLCVEKFTDVQVVNSVINLELGAEMSCEPDEVLRGESDVNLQLCFGTSATCLDAIPLGSTPYAVRATWVQQAERAHRVDRATQTHYTHRFTADADLGEREVLGAGYFDTETPDAARAAGVYDAEGFAPYAGSGFFQWAPVRNREGRTLVVAARDHASRRLRQLAELVLGGVRTMIRGGDLRVEPATDAGLQVLARGMHATGDSVFHDAVRALGRLFVTTDLSVTGSVDVDGPLSVGAGVTATSAPWSVAGDSAVDGDLGIGADADVDGAIVTRDTALASPLGAPSASVTTRLDVAGSTNAPAVTIAAETSASTALDAGEGDVAGDLDVDGLLTVNEGIEADGEAVFTGNVTFLGGRSDPTELPDMRYVQFEDETRALSFEGMVTLEGGGATGASLDGAFHRLVAARMPVHSAAPVPCDASAQGVAYLDSTLHLFRVCLNGRWLAMGGM